MKRKKTNRLLAWILSILLLIQVVPLTTYATQIDEETTLTDEQIREIILSAPEELKEKYPSGLFSFLTPAYGVKRTVGSFEVLILRYGGLDNEIEIGLSTSDINATYGSDYTIEIDSLETKRLDSAMQFLATADMDDMRKVFTNEEYLLTEDSVDDGEEEIAEKVYEEIKVEDFSDSVSTMEKSNVLDENSSMHDVKESVFNRQLSQTEEFYSEESLLGVGGLETFTVADVMRDEIFASSQNVLSFEKGEYFKRIKINILNSSSDGDESFILNLQDTPEFSEEEEAIFHASSTVVIKHEGEIKESLIGFETASIESENDVAVVNVKRNGNIYVPSTVFFTTESEDAIAGEDYVSCQQTLLFMPGEEEKEITIPVNSDSSGKTFSCRLDNVQGAELGANELDVLIAQPNIELSVEDISAFAANNAGTKKLNLSKETGFHSSTGANIFNVPNDKKLMRSYLSSYSTSDRSYYGILQAKDKVPAVAYKNVKVNFDSHAMIDKYYWASWSRTWDKRFSNNFMVSLWDEGKSISKIYTKDDPGQNQTRTGSGVRYTEWQHRGSWSREHKNNTINLLIPNNSNQLYSLSFQQQHIRQWLSQGQITINSVELEKRLIRFNYLKHDTFERRDGSLNNKIKVDNIFTLEPTGGKGSNTTYYIGDTVSYQAKPAANDPLYQYMTAQMRYGVKDEIWSSSTAPKHIGSLGVNSVFGLDNNFFKNFSKYFNQYGGGDQKISYIKPKYNKESVKAKVSLQPSIDGSAQLGFTNASGSIVDIKDAPAYLSENIILRAKPDNGLYYKGYKLEYVDYNKQKRVRYEEVPASQITSGDIDIKVKVEFPEMKITPLFTSLPQNSIEITVDETSRKYGEVFEEGIIESYRGMSGERTKEIELGDVITLTAIAKKGYVPVWTMDGKKYSGNTLDFVFDEAGKRAVNLGFKNTNTVMLSVEGEITEPEVTINSLMATNYGARAPKIPKPNVTVATGFNSTKSDNNGKYVIPKSFYESGSSRELNTLSIRGTFRTIRVIDGESVTVKEISVPNAGNTEILDIFCEIDTRLPFNVFGDITYTKLINGETQTLVSDFGGNGQAESSLYRYDTETSNAIMNFSMPSTYDINFFSKATVSFADKNGSVIKNIEIPIIKGQSFNCNFNPIKDTRNDGRVFVTMTTKNDYKMGPYDTGISTIDPPSGDIDLVESPSIEIPMKEKDLGLMDFKKPKFSSSVFDASFTSEGLDIVIGFDVEKIMKGYEKSMTEVKKNAAKAKGINEEAKAEEKKSDAQKADGGKADAVVEANLQFAVKMHWGYFNKTTHQPEKTKTSDSVLLLDNVFFFLGVSAKASKQFPTTVYGVPVYFEIGGELDVAIFVNISAVNENNKKVPFKYSKFSDETTTLKVDGKVPIGMMFYLEAGIGIKKIAAAAVGGELGLDFVWIPWDKGGSGDLNFDAYAAVYILGAQLKAKYRLVETNLFDTMGRAADGELEVVTDMIVVESNQTMVLDENFDTVPGGINPSWTETLLVEEILHDGHHKILDIGNDKIMMTFIADDEDDERSGMNTSALYYTIYDQSTLEFSTPKIIDDDETMDMSPNLLDIGDRVFITWANSFKEDHDISDNITDILSTFEIHGAFYDKAKDEITEVVDITKDNKNFARGFANTQPASVYNEESGEIYTYYLKEDFSSYRRSFAAGEAAFMNGESTLAYAVIDAKTESVVKTYDKQENISKSAQTLLDGQRLVDLGLTRNGTLSDPKIEEFTVAMEDGKIIFIYPVDLDQNVQTDDDTDIFMVIRETDGTTSRPINITNNQANVKSLDVTTISTNIGGKPYNVNRLVWKSNNKILAYDLGDLLENGLEKIEENVYMLNEDYLPYSLVAYSEEDELNNKDFLVAMDKNEGLYMVTTLSENGNTEIAIRYFDGSFGVDTDESITGVPIDRVEHAGEWSQLVQMTNTADTEDRQKRILIKDLTPTSGGGMYVLYDEFFDDEPIGELKLAIVKPLPHLADEPEISIDKDYPMANEEIMVNAKIRSEGLLASENLTVDFYFKDEIDGKKHISSETVIVPAGGEIEVLSGLTLPSEINGDETIIVEYDGAEFTYDLPYEEAVWLDEISYGYISDDDSISQITVGTTLTSIGNKEIERLDIEIIRIDREKYNEEMNSDSPNFENSFEVLKTIVIANPFETEEYIEITENLDIQKKTDEWFPEIMIRVKDSSDEIYNSATVFAKLYPRQDFVTPALEDIKLQSKLPKYMVEITHSLGGNTDVDSMILMSRTDEKVVTFIPDKGYEVSDVIYNGNRLGKMDSIKLSGIEENKTLHILFRKIGGVRFVDVPDGRWSAEYVYGLTDKDIVHGVGKNMFKPAENITRAEFVKIVAGVLEADVSEYKKSSFKDVSETDWYLPYVEWAYANQIVFGVGNNNFRPNDFILRQDMAVIVDRCIDIFEQNLTAKTEKIIFSDEEDISRYAKDSVGFLQELNIINGEIVDEKTFFRPRRNASREEASKILYSYYRLVHNE